MTDFAMYAGSMLGVSCRSGNLFCIFKTLSIPFPTVAHRNTGFSALVCSTTDKQVFPTLNLAELELLPKDVLKVQ